MKFFQTVFKFFASLQLAIFLLLSLGAVFAVGTFVESVHGVEAARQAVYDTALLSALLIVLALNLAAAALDRIPWKLKHTGFVVTHAGIIMILAGSLITRAYGREGQIAIEEGETLSRMILSEPVLQVLTKDGHPPAPLRLPKKAFPWKGKEKLAEGIHLLQFLPKAGRKETVEPAPEGTAALHVSLQSSFMKSDHWLILDDSLRNRIPLGPAELRFGREKIEKPAAESSPSFGHLELNLKDSSVNAPVPEKIPHTFNLENTPYRITIRRVLKDAGVEGGKLMERSNEWANPAVELLIEGNGIKETHTVFSQFPDFPTIHGIKPSETGIRIFFRRPESPARGPKNELRFVWRENKLPVYQVKKGDAVSEGEVDLDREVETGWMDFKFKADAYHPSAVVKSEFSEEPVNSQAEEHVSAVELEAGAPAKRFWLGQGDREPVRINGNDFDLAFGLRTQPLGFRLRLRDFRVQNYPGTQRPASFESDVTVIDDSNGNVRDELIQMNRPLSFRGYRIFQSGYQQLPGVPEVSVLTVARDPGIPLKYAGAVVLIGGLLMMFYTKRFSNTTGKNRAKGNYAK